MGQLAKWPKHPAKSERLTFTAILHHSSHLYLILNLYLYAIVCLYLYLVLILKFLFPLWLSTDAVGAFFYHFFHAAALLLSGSRQITGGDELFDLSAAYMVFTLDYMRSHLSSCLDKLSWWRLHTNYTTNYILKSCFDWLRIFSWTWKNTQPLHTSETCLKTHFHLLAFKSEWSLSIFTQVSMFPFLFSVILASSLCYLIILDVHQFFQYLLFCIFMSNRKNLTWAKKQSKIKQ